jgi:hypothetical protein
MRLLTQNLVLFGLTALLVPRISIGGPLVYALSNAGSAPAQFGTLDLASGAFSSVGSTGSVGIGECLGYGSNGTLYAMGRSGLFTIDPSSGAATLVGNYGGPALLAAAITPSGAMYGVTDQGATAATANLSLYSINPATGVASVLGTIMPAPANFAIALGAVGNALYLTVQASTATSGTLYQLNPLTAKATAVGSSDSGISGLVYVSGSLYAFTSPFSNSTSAHIATISLANGTSSVVANLNQGGTAFPTAFITGAATVQKVVPRFAFGGGWYSALYLTNTGSAPVAVFARFINDDGSPMSVPRSAVLR